MQDLWDIVERGYPRQDGARAMRWTNEKQKEFKENQKKDAIALRYIKQGVSKTIYPSISGKRKAKDAWEVLKMEYRGDDKFFST